MTKKVNIRFGLGFDLIIESDNRIDDSDLLKIIKPNPKKENEYRALDALEDSMTKLSPFFCSLLYALVKHSFATGEINKYVAEKLIKQSTMPSSRMHPWEWFADEDSGMMECYESLYRLRFGYSHVHSNGG